MNILWYVLRPFYYLGLVPVIPLFLFVAAHLGKDIEVEIPVLLGCLVYFALGFMLLRVIPSALRNRLMRRVAAHKAQGFVPRLEVISVLHNRYVGFDLATRRALYVDINDKTEELVDFDKVNSWELDEARNKPALLKLLTRAPNLPVLGIRIDKHKADEWKSHLGALFG